MDKDLTITTLGTPEGHSCTLQLQGPLLMANMFEFQRQVRNTQARELVVDMTNVPYVDSAGIGVLVGAYVSREKDGRSLQLVGVNSRVRTTLQVTQVERFFKFADTLPKHKATGA